MKKFTKSCLLAFSSVIMCASLGVATLVASADTTTYEAAAEQNAATEISVTGIHKRGNQLLMFLSTSDYTTATDPVGDKKDGLNILTNIKIYTTATDSVTLNTAHTATGSTQENYFNIWTEPNSISFAMGVEYTGKAIYAVEIPAGTEFPSQAGGAGYVTSATVTYYNQNYGTDQLMDGGDWYISWTTEAPSTPTPPPVTPEPGQKTEVSITGIHKRLNELMLFLSDSDYTVGNDPVGAKKDGLNTLTNIKVYTDATNSVTLQTAHEAEGTTLENYFYLWGEANTITFAMGSAYNGKAIYAVEIPAGTEFPSQAGGAGYVTSATVTYYNQNYGTDQLADGSDWYVSWTTEAPNAPTPPDTPEPSEKTDVTVSVIKMHDRDERLFFFLSEHDYASVPATTLVDTADAGLNTLDKILVYSTKNSYKTLRSIYEATADKAKYFNLYGEQGAIAYDVKTANNSYNGSSLYAVKILEGCQFASATGEYNYVTDTEIVWYNNAFGGATADIDHNSFSTTAPEGEAVFKTAVNAIQYRDNRLIMKLTNSNYTQEGNPVAANTSISADAINASTILESVKIYTSESQFVTLGDVFTAGTNEAWFNLYSETPSVAFDLSQAYTGDQIYAVEILGGCTIPSCYAEETLLAKDGVYFKNNEYGTAKSEAWYVDWALQMPAEADTEIALRNELHIRADVFPEGHEKAGQYQTVKLYFFLQGVDYQDYAGSTESVLSAGKTYEDLTQYNTLDNILLWTSETEYITLGEAYNGNADDPTRPATKEVYFNCFGEKNSLVFDISGYNGLSFVKITVLGGCEFPSARALKGMINEDKAYVNTETINYIDWLQDETFSTNWRIDNNMGSTSISSVAVDAQNGVFSYGLTNSDYPTDSALLNIDTKNLEEALTENYTKILLNGVTLEDITIYETDADGKSYFNYGANGVFGLELPGYDVSQITKVVFMKGCQIPTYVNTELGIANYGVMYYTLSETVMFVKNENGVFEKKDSFTWSVQFGDVETREVVDGEKLGTLPTATQAGYKFLGWYNGQAKVTEDTVVTKDLVLTAKFAKVYTVTFDTDGGSAVESQTIEEGDKFIAPTDPTKEGYTFKGWYNGDEAYDFNAIPDADVTLTAKWEKNAAGIGSGCAGVGCFGTVDVSVLAVLTLLPVALVLYRRKEENN